MTSAEKAARFRPGPGFRALAAAVLAFFAVLLLLVALAVVHNRRASDTVFRLPLPNKVAAIVDLLDQTPPEQRTLVLRAVSSGDFVARIEPSAVMPDLSGELRSATFRKLIERYTDAMEGRRVSAMVGVRARRSMRAEPIISGDAVAARYPMRLVVELSPGEFLVIETPSIFDASISRAPIGLGAGVSGLVIAAIALWTIWGELRPVRDMARSARAFANAGRPSAVTPGGSAEMRALAAEFNTMQDRIAKLMANRTLLMSAMSHDVRTYMTRLRLRVEMLDEENRRAAVQTLDDMQALLDDTLAFAEAESGAPRSDTIELGPLFAKMAALGPMTFSAPDGAAITGHAGRLERALTNIITNAVKYGGQADVSARRAGKDWMIEIADRGPGIPKDQRQSVFEPFHRLESSRNRRVEGAGLGLAIARTIIRRHGGDIVLEDRTGGGLVARVTLPGND